MFLYFSFDVDYFFLQVVIFAREDSVIAVYVLNYVI